MKTKKTKHCWQDISLKVFLILMFASVFFFLMRGTLANRIVVLNCNKAFQATDFFTTETAVLFSGKQNMQSMPGGAIDLCDDVSINELEDCNNFEKDGKKQSCEFVFGVKAKIMSDCGGNYACEFGFASSHISDCAVYKSKPAEFTQTCLFSKAFITQDKLYCEGINVLTASGCGENPYQCYLNKSKCQWGVADNRNDVRICDEIGAGAQGQVPEKAFCYFSFAVRNKDVSLCQKFWKNWPVVADVCVQVVKRKIDPVSLGKGILNMF